MDDIQSVISFLESEVSWLTEQKQDTDTILGEVYKEIDGDKRVQIMQTAISAMQELKRYRELGTVEQVSNQKHNLGVAYNMLGKYQMTGNPEECQEARRKQRAIPPRKAFLFEGKQAEIADRNGIKNFDTYRCPECGRIVAERTVVRSVYPDGFIKYKYCKDCGQKLDWGDKYD